MLYVLGNVLNAIPHLVIMGFAGRHLAEHHPEVLSDQDVILSAPGFEVQQIVTGLAFLLGLIILGIALVRAEGIPTWVGVMAVSGAAVPFLPLPLMPVVSGVQIELLRGALAVVLGVLAIRSVARRDVAANPEKISNRMVTPAG